MHIEKDIKPPREKKKEQRTPLPLPQNCAKRTPVPVSKLRGRRDDGDDDDADDMHVGWDKEDANRGDRPSHKHEQY